MAALAILAAILTPLALDGEAAVEGGSNGELLGVLSAVSIVGGYVVLFLLWRFVFSAKARAKREKAPDWQARKGSQADSSTVDHTPTASQSRARLPRGGRERRRPR
jgi:hypothetical protein